MQENATVFNAKLHVHNHKFITITISILYRLYLRCIFQSIQNKSDFIIITIYLFKCLKIVTSFEAFPTPSLFRALECIYPKVENTRSIPAELQIAVNNCSTKCPISFDNLDCFFNDVHHVNADILFIALSLNKYSFLVHIY